MKYSLLIAVIGGIVKYSANPKTCADLQVKFWLPTRCALAVFKDLKQSQGKFTSRITKIIHDFFGGTLVPGGGSVGIFS